MKSAALEAVATPAVHGIFEEAAGEAGRVDEAFGAAAGHLSASEAEAK
jgi:hypothetical protein